MNDALRLQAILNDCQAAIDVGAPPGLASHCRDVIAETIEVAGGAGLSVAYRGGSAQMGNPLIWIVAGIGSVAAATVAYLHYEAQPARMFEKCFQEFLSANPHATDGEISEARDRCERLASGGDTPIGETADLIGKLSTLAVIGLGVYFAPTIARMIGGR